MKRPVLWLLGFLICGIVLGAYGSAPIYGLGTLLGLFVCAALYRMYKYRPVFVFALFLLLGLWRVGHSLHNVIEHPTPAVVTGVARDIGVTAGGNQRVVVHADSGLRVMAYIRAHQPWASLGQEITLTGELMPLAGPQNPGGYNQFRHLRSQKIDATMGPDTVTLGDVRLSPTVVLRMARDRLAAVYDGLLPPREAAVVRSMVLGDRGDMDGDLANQYRAMGIFHILSISGLHVAILMMAFNKVMGLFLSERKSGLVVLVVMVLYCLMTGAGIATVRAVTMGGVLVFGKVLGRKYDLLAAVSWACVALLLYEPLYLFNAGFQLSFAAVFGIGTLSAPVDRLLAKLRMRSGNFRKGLGVGIAAVISTYPVFAFHMYEIQLYSVVGNLVVAPTSAIILVMGLAVGLLGLVWTGGAAVLAGTVYFILRFYEIASSFFAALPHAMLLTGGGNLVVTGLGVAVLLVFMYAFSGFEGNFRKRLGLLSMVTTLFVAALFVRHHPAGLHITALDTTGGYTVMRHRNEVLVVGAAQGGEAALLRYLDMHGVRRASGLVLTEPPTPRDMGRLAQLAQRFETIYVAESAADAVALMVEHGVDMSQVVLLAGGDVYRAGNKRVYFFTCERGGVSARVAFGDMAMHIGEAAGDAHVHVVDGVIKTASDVFFTAEGAVGLHVNGRRIRVR
ncbi:MAG: ComEC family competence protein [Defluviitaleaceae bacterium]|nr:ComEC family competence protein [Defluviitaleaceae bacterium]